MTLADAVADLGKPEGLGNGFAGFLRCLYHPQAETGPQHLESRVECVGRVMAGIVRMASAVAQ